MYKNKKYKKYTKFINNVDKSIHLYVDNLYKRR